MLANFSLQLIILNTNIKSCQIELFLYTLLILHFTTNVFGQKAHEIEILVNTVHKYNSYGLQIMGIQIHEKCIIDAWNGESTM